MPETPIKKWELNAVQTELEHKIEANTTELTYIKQSLERRDKRFAEYQKQTDAAFDEISKERESNLRASRNVIVGALVTLAVGLVGFLIQRGFM